MPITQSEASPDDRRLDEERNWWTPGRRHYVLGILCVIGIFNFIDRQILAILLEPIKTDLGVSDTLMGLLSGLAFSTVYVLAGIPIARIVDTGSRRILLSSCLGIWSLATMLCGLSQSFLHLALARIGVAGGEAGGAPASQSMLADLYPARNRGTVIGILSAAQAIGIALGLFLGGWLNALFDWRSAFLVVGAPGLLLALITLFTVREPARGMSEEISRRANVEEPASMSQALRQALRNPALRILLLVAMSCSFAGYSILGWGPTFYVRVHGLSTMQVGLFMGLGVAVGLFLGNLFAGQIADRVAKGDLSKYMKVGGIGTILSAPAGVVFVLAEDLTVSLLGLFVSKLLMTFWLPPTYAVALGLSSPGNRGMMTALLGLAGSLVGTGLGPLFVGIMNDVFTPIYGADGIRYSLLIVLVGLALSGALCLISIPFVRREQQRMAAAG
ncbi:MAG: MFS transporter [Sphingobium sp.]